MEERLLHAQMPHMHQYLQHMEPLPKLPELRAAQGMLDKLHRGVSLAAELAHFVGRAAALPAVLRSRALASMEAGMRLRQHELLLPEGCAVLMIGMDLAQGGLTQPGTSLLTKLLALTRPRRA